MPSTPGINLFNIPTQPSDVSGKPKRGWFGRRKQQPAAVTPPLPFYLGGVQNPIDWIDAAGHNGGFAGAMPSSLMRGTPGALSPYQRRQGPRQPTLAQAMPIWLQSRPYDRGAGAYSPHFGTINYNPIGAGIYAPYKLPPIAGPGARYMYAAIWFDVQSIPTSIQINPTIPLETVNALIQTGSVGPSYLTTG